MFRFLEKLLSGQNQFASGGLLLMIIGALSVYLRALPKWLWAFVIEQTTMMVTVKDDDAAFVWVKEWFLEQGFLKRIRRVDLDSTLRGEMLALIPAPGRHWFWYGRRPFCVWFIRSEESKGWSARRIESLTFMTLGRKQSILRGFVDDLVACHKSKIRRVSYLYLYDDGWRRVQAYTPRSIDSVILKPGEKEHLLQDLQKFTESRQRYRDLGVPYHRGYLFYGPPGTGKTSLVSSLAARFGMSVYVVNLTEFNDRTLRSAITDVLEHSIVLFEDIDCMKTGNARPQGELGLTNPIITEDHGKKDASDMFGVTLSGLLNVLDGFNAPESVLFAMTTNRIEVLDKALLRPGRIDYKLFLGRAADSQKIELYRKFFPESSRKEAREFVEANPSAETMAEFQGLLLTREQKEEVRLELASM